MLFYKQGAALQAQMQFAATHCMLPGCRSLDLQSAPAAAAVANTAYHDGGVTLLLLLLLLSQVLHVQDLTHGYNGRTLFKDVDLEIEKGERIAIIGPNGEPLSCSTACFSSVRTCAEGVFSRA